MREQNEFHWNFSFLHLERLYLARLRLGERGPDWSRVAHQDGENGLSTKPN